MSTVEAPMKPMTTDDARWEAVETRDATQDGEFVYAVRSTGIYCRPSCPSRKPARDRVELFERPDDAEAGGYRACRRCNPRSVRADVALAAQVIEIMDSWPEGAPTLAELGVRTGVSPFHLQRTFKKITGVSPAAYARGQRMQRFRDNLRDGEDVTTSIYASGFESASPLYASVEREIGMTPLRYQAGGEGIAMTYAIADSPVGKLLVAFTERGVSAILLGDSDDELVDTLRREYPRAELHVAGGANEFVRVILRYLGGKLPHPDLPIDIQSTAFQRAVWEALQAIPAGETRSYGEIATAIGRPTAFRAVAQACKSNRVALAIPCHRVVKSDGSTGGYRWGEARKRALLELEHTRLGQSGVTP
jgi:AraC family transcriptional regulator of adaptative response/methylated-DNA-[protein]-cysteine methyltransferase